MASISDDKFSRKGVTESVDKPPYSSPKYNHHQRQLHESKRIFIVPIVCGFILFFLSIVGGGNGSSTGGVSSGVDQHVNLDVSSEEIGQELPRNSSLQSWSKPQQQQRLTRKKGILNDGDSDSEDNSGKQQGLPPSLLSGHHHGTSSSTAPSTHERDPPLQVAADASQLSEAKGSNAANHGNGDDARSADPDSNGNKNEKRAAKNDQKQQAALDVKTIPDHAYFHDCMHRENSLGDDSLSSSSEIHHNNSGQHWSLTQWRKAYCSRLDKKIKTFSSSTRSRQQKSMANQILFVDAKEECGRYREFLLTVRESGYAGMIVMFIYYAEDVEPCNELFSTNVNHNGGSGSSINVDDVFQPIIVHYDANIPRYEIGLMVHHGIVSVVEKARELKRSLEQHQHQTASHQQRTANVISSSHTITHGPFDILSDLLFSSTTSSSGRILAAIVRPESVEWCTNPFVDFDHLFYHNESSKGESNDNRLGAPTTYAPYLYTHLQHRLRTNGPVDNFMIGQFDVLYKAIKTIATRVKQQDRHVAHPSFSYLESIESVRSVVKTFDQIRAHIQIPSSSSSFSSSSSITIGSGDWADRYAPHACFTVNACGRGKGGGVKSQHHYCFTTDESDYYGSWKSAPIASFFRHRTPASSDDSNGKRSILSPPAIKTSPSKSPMELLTITHPPSVSPYCYLAYRHAISEVPRDGSVSLAAVGGNVNTSLLQAIKVINAATNLATKAQISSSSSSDSSHVASQQDPNAVYVNPTPLEQREKIISKQWGGFSEACPNGRMAVLSMMGKYMLFKVDLFLTSFLLNANKNHPHRHTSSNGDDALGNNRKKIISESCTKLVVLLKWNDDVKSFFEPPLNDREEIDDDKDMDRRKEAEHRLHRQWTIGIGAIANLNPSQIEVVYYTESMRNFNKMKKSFGVPSTSGEQQEEVKRQDSGGGGENKTKVEDDAHSIVLEATATRAKYTLILLQKFYRKRNYVDQRFEVGREWLELNHKDYRYATNIDSRDIIFLGDPLTQMVKIMKENGPVKTSTSSGEQSEGQNDSSTIPESYIHDEWVGSVTESYPLGSFSTNSEAITHFAKMWMSATCGDKCFNYFGGKSYTNNEPLAVINSGHIVGTAVGLLQYYRLHVRVTIEANYDFATSDQGTFTFFYYGVATDAQFPHRLLCIHSSRSGFANPPHFHRVTRRQLSDDELAATDSLHQAQKEELSLILEENYGRRRNRIKQSTNNSSVAPDDKNGKKSEPKSVIKDLNLSSDRHDVTTNDEAFADPFEYSIRDCVDNTVVVSHQGNRDPALNMAIKRGVYRAGQNIELLGEKARKMLEDEIRAREWRS